MPLDPEYPAARLAGMMEDAGVEILLTQSQVAGASESAAHRGEWWSWTGSGRPLIKGVGRTRRLRLQPRTWPMSSTPRARRAGPKGVMVTHQSLVNFTLEMARQLELRGSDRMLQFASLSFDVFAEEVFPVWSRGGAVVLVGSQWLAAGAEFTRLLERQGVTGCELPAAFWHEWLRELSETDARPPQSLRFVMVGCEKPWPERVAQWHRSPPQSCGACSG